MSRIFFASLLFFLLILPREPWGGAARLHVASARALVAHGNLDVAGETGPDTQVHDGRRYARVPLGPTLLLAPLEGALLLLPHTEAGARVSRFLEGASAAAGAALLCALFFASLLTLGVQRRAAGLATLALAAASTIAVYARVPDGSVWAALLVLVAVERARAFQRDPNGRGAALLGAACAALILFDLTPAALVLLAFAVAFTRARRPLAWALPSLAVAVALVLWHQQLTAAPPEPRGDLIEGLDGLLLSTGKSLFAYSPPLILSLVALPFFWHNRRSHAVLLLAVAAAVILPAASLERWDGDPAWGPRRLVPLVPLLAMPAALWVDLAGSRAWSRAARACLVLVFAAGVLVQVLGAAFPPETYLHIAAVVKNTTGASGWFAEPDQAHFVPQFSPLTGHAWLLSHLVRHDRKLEASTPWTLLVPSTPKLDAEWPKLRLDWWALAMTRDTVAK